MTRPETAARRRGERGMTMIEILISFAILAMMLTSVWSSFRGALNGLETVEDVQDRYRILRNGMSRITRELSMAYLSKNRPVDLNQHFTLRHRRKKDENRLSKNDEKCLKSPL